jgi:hypothetical protein
MTARRRVCAFLGLTGLIAAALGGVAPAEALPPSPTSTAPLTRPKVVPIVVRDAGLDAGSFALPPLSTVAYHVDPGASISIQPGTRAGYGIAASAGAKYRIVWTGDAGASGTFRQFSGSVCTRGTFTSFVRGCENQACPLEADDWVSQPFAVSGGQCIVWDALTTTGIDGFDFTVSAEPVYLDMDIDGQRSTMSVYFTSGGTMSNPATFPFGLKTK